MTRRLLAFLFAIVPASLVSAQGAGLPKDFASLVPSDSFAVVVIRSTHELTERLEYGRTKSAQAAPTVDDAFVLERLLAGMFSADTSLIDASKPIGIAFRFDSTSPEPVATFIVPAADPKALMTSLEKKEGVEPPVQAGNYVGIPTGAGAYKRDSASRLLNGMPSGLIAGRVDLAAVILKFRPIIDMGLEQAEGMVDSGQLEQMDMRFSSPEDVEMYLEIAHEIVDSAELLEASTDVRDGDLGLKIKLQSREGSPLAKYSRVEAIDYRALAGRLDPQALLVVLTAYDQGTWFERMWKSTDSLYATLEEESPEFAAALRTYMERLKVLMPKFGRVGAMSVDVDVTGVRTVGSYQSPDPRGLLDGMLGLLRDPSIAKLGVQASDTRDLELAGIKAVGFQVKFDLDKMLETIAAASGGAPPADSDDRAEIQKIVDIFFGKDGLPIVYLPSADRFNMLAGGDEAWRTNIAKRLTSGGAVSPFLERSIRNIAGANPGGLVQVDIARGAASIAAFAALFDNKEDADEAAFFAGMVGTQPLPASVYWGASGTTWTVGASIEFECLLRLVQAVNALDAIAARRHRAKRDIAFLTESLEHYVSTHDGELPDSIDRFMPVTDADGKTIPPKDPWGRPYLYEKDLDATPAYSVRTLGADGKEGGTGENEDVSSD